MQLAIHKLELQLKNPFTISRGTMHHQTSLVVQLSADGISGWGEVTQNRYYNRTFDSLARSVVRAESLLDRIPRESPEVMWPELMRLLDGDTFAVSAIDIAAHDWHARRAGMPTWQWWGLDWQNTPNSSYTIAIDSIDIMLDKLRAEPDWPIYKIKLGTPNDLEIVRQIRAATRALLRVDANCAWTAEQVLDFDSELEVLGVELIEQPLPREASIKDRRKVFSGCSLPVIADESCQIESDVIDCHSNFHGINIKLCKCGGLTPALRMLRQAKELGMKTMVGCMIESSIGINAAAQLLPLLDYADLDGSALLAHDPTLGIRLCNGRFQKPLQSGHGTGLA